MSEETYSYDVNQITCTVGTALIDSGYPDGDVVTVETNKDDWEFEEGADGTVGFSKTNSGVSKVTLRLQQGSKHNDELSAIRILDKSTPGGLMVPFYLNDRGGRSLVTSIKCRILGPPKTVTFAGKISVREWVIILTKTVRFDGGNA